MEDLRYPIGRFTYPGEFTESLKEQWIHEIASAPKRLRQAVNGLTANQLDTPYRPGGWTIRQVVHHISDSYMNCYVRFKWTLTEDHPTIKPYQEALWAELPDTFRTPVETSLVMMEALTERWVALLGAMSMNDYERTMNHPEAGSMTLAFALGMYAWHGNHHIAHILGARERNHWT